MDVGFYQGKHTYTDTFPSVHIPYFSVVQQRSSTRGEHFNFSKRFQSNATIDLDPTN